MVVRQETHPGTGAGAEPAGVPGGGRDACARPGCGPRSSARRCRRRSGSRRTPSALSADVTVDGDDLGTGRIILLHDPAGNDAWDGTFRCVAYARAEIDPELITDPMLAAVGWSWLTEALEAHGATYTAASGTVTRVATESFGGMADEGGTAQIEIRASWTPRRRPTTSRRSTSRRTSRRGASCCAPPSGCRRCPRGHRDAEPPRPARPRTLTTDDGPMPPDDRPTSRRATTEPETPEPARCCTLRDGLPAGRRDRGRARRALCDAHRRRAPARSRSTPSARRATATPTAPT